MPKDEIILGAGEVYMYEFTGSNIPDHKEIETELHNVGHCSGGFTIEYKPEKYDVKNQYGKTVKSFIVKEEISTKTGILTWDLSKLALLSTAKIKETSDKRTLTFGGGGSLKTVLLRFVHEKDDGKKIRFTMIGQGGNGFSLDFSDKELTIDSQISAIEYIKNFLAEFEEELTISQTFDVNFKVKENSSGLQGANIIINGQYNLITGVDGAATIKLQEGTYSYAVTKDTYTPQGGAFVVKSSTVTVPDVTLVKA
ncbi:hypothetical protein QUW36_12635 [Clostridium cadaveris]|uniref:hypothetical protein n=1 Tax=Clostridium cadaveris TaxID=1529 RepID=UPI0025A32686|nr:hypothetical protein [Clostridium cadaveris]MDM8312907.1 hypothetical protein [Clostridium cadaveris]